MIHFFQHLFWYAFVKTVKCCQYVLLAIIPDFIVKREVIRILESCGIQVVMDYESKNNEDVENNKKYRVKMIIHNPRFFKRFAYDDTLALAESYMDGWWDTDALNDIITCLLSGTEPNWIHEAENALYVAGNGQTREKSFQVVEEHYNLGNDLYEAMLDPTMNYTCAYWTEDTKTLEEAQKNKMDLIARKLHLKPGMKVLDIGSGFGAMAKYLAKNYKVSVTGYNISKEQLTYARKNCEGLDVTFIEDDYRNATGQFDRIYSVGFFEAVGVRNFREYFQVVDCCLKPDGITLLHSITIRDGQTRTPKFIRDYIFPGGELPFASEYLTYSKDFFVCEDMQTLGMSYSKTLHAWRKNFDAAWENNLKAKYGDYHNGKFYSMWQFYLMMSAGAFEGRATHLHQTVFTKLARKEEYKSVR